MAKNKKFSGGGASQRQLRVGELIRRTLSEVLIRGDVHDPDLNRMSITVSEVRVTPDLSIATAYVLPLGGKGKDEAIASLAANKGELRRLLSKEMTTKHTPDLRFVLDETFDRMDETNRLLSDETVRKDVSAPSDEA
ncbi:30S ribosome-binding factor RbfA [uncultured Litoreibacter sp.]|uniref:30S ribosome-binding factor RbfA n=1 Tax=uncultured Litoreibacter sp. TaxID=1392394 RepID=UPI00260C10C6|nr:30S ribosome-binding factor RbfA [uncultured Litoreibacter sp.]